VRSKKTILWCALLALSLAGCGHTPVTRTLFDTFGKAPGVDAINLNPAYRYLRVSVGGRDALLVLGYSDSTPVGPIETWYSNAGEVLKLQNGRIVSTVGLRIDWRTVTYTDLPSWSDVVNSSSAQFMRKRDEMPGHRFGISETVMLYPVKPPSDARLVGVSAKELMWFEETVQASPKPLPSARYGLSRRNGAPTVIYGEQCLARDLCIAWQAWPASSQDLTGPS
jgi:hypothetical protein